MAQVFSNCDAALPFALTKSLSPRCHTIQRIKPGMFGFWRQSLDRRQSLFVVTNITRENKRLSLRDMNLFADTKWVDLLSGVTVNPEDEELELVPYQTVWISNKEH